MVKGAWPDIHNRSYARYVIMANKIITGSDSDAAAIESINGNYQVFLPLTRSGILHITTSITE